MDCYGVPSQISNLSCNITPTKHGSTIVNINLDLVKPLESILVHYVLFKRSNGFQPYLVDFKVDLCKILKFRNIQIPYMDVIFDLMQKYSNVNHTCPYTGRIIFKDLQLNASAIPSFMPTGEYRLNATCTNRNEYFGSGAFYFVIGNNNVDLQ